VRKWNGRIPFYVGVGAEIWDIDLAEEETAPVVDEKPSTQAGFFAILAVLVVASVVLADLDSSSSVGFKLALSEIVIVWTSLLLIYFLFNRPFLLKAERARRVQSWAKRWLYTTNHKDIGTLYIVTALFFALVGGTLAELMRTQLETPNNNFLSALSYNQALSMHGLIMIFWFLSPLAFGFANYIVPLQIKAKDLAFPRLNALSYWLFAFSGLLAVTTFFLPGGAIDGGWTLYSPLTSTQFMPGPGPTVGFSAFMLMVGSVTISSVNFIVTMIALRGPGITFTKVPMFTWFIIFTIVQMLFAFPAILGALFMLIADRVASTLFFSAAGGAMLWDNLFWFFGHPEVYIVLMPSFGAIAEILPVFTRRRIFAKTAILIATFSLVVPLSFLVWGHHMFMTTLPDTEKLTFMISTIGISLPFDIIVVAFLMTLVRGRILLRTPMLFALGAIVVFIIGGITGVFLASIPLDVLFRGTYFVVGHFHYVMVGASVFGLFAAFYYWFPRMTGRMYNEVLAKTHFWTSMIAFNITYFPMFILLDMPRRIFTYSVPAWALPNFISTIGAYLFGGVQVIFVINLAYSIYRGAPSVRNPWKAETAEWEWDSELGDLGGPVQPSMSSSLPLGMGMSSLVPFTPTVKNLAPSEVVGRQTVTELEPNTIEMHHTSTRPITIAGGIAVGMFGVGLIGYDYLGLPFAVLGAAICGVALFGWAWDDLHGRFHIPEPLEVEKWPFTKISKMKLGVWSLIFSDIILFAAILTSDVYVRLSTASWPAPGTLHPIGLGLVSTLILLSSSPAAFMALNSIRKGDKRGLITWLAITLALGTIFDGLEFYEWSLLFASGMGPATSNALSTYFFTIGLHASHVLVGLLAMVYLIVKASKGGFTKENHEAVEIFGIYWSFVDAIWVFIFPLFFLV
jgi:cytochrome c oxidase subunit I+III